MTGNPKYADDTVALELVDVAVVPDDHLPHDIAVGRDHREVVLRIEALAQWGRSDDVGEQHREVPAPLLGGSPAAVGVGGGEDRGRRRLVRYDREHLPGETGRVVRASLIHRPLGRVQDRGDEPRDV